MIVKNCTPHAIDIWDADGRRIIKTIEKSGTIARLSESNEPLGLAADCIPLSRTVYGAPIDLPEPQPGVLLIVSVVVKAAFPERSDLVIPVELVRDDEGRIIGCRSLGC